MLLANDRGQVFPQAMRACCRCRCTLSFLVAVLGNASVLSTQSDTTDCNALHLRRATLEQRSTAPPLYIGGYRPLQAAESDVRDRRVCTKGDVRTLLFLLTGEVCRYGSSYDNRQYPNDAA